jgi:hypothetical protein
MKWLKKGLVYNAHEYQLDWAQHSALTPTPFLIAENIIRVYFAARDTLGISRIRFVDLNANNPSEILFVSPIPALDIGKPGAFDDNGVILGDVIPVKEKLYMFYVGFQLVEKVKFLAFSGLAISHDDGKTFVRTSDAPILDRSNEGIYIRAIHTVLFENGTWRIWYAAGNEWTYISDTPYPNYYIKYLQTTDIYNLPKAGISCIQQQNTEYRIGRPRVYKTNQDYHLYYTKGALDSSYLPGYATSGDGINWKRFDDSVGISPSTQGWDSETLCYPSLIKVPSGKTYMFYNGNAMGKDGFGYAELADES